MNYKQGLATMDTKAGLCLLLEDLQWEKALVKLGQSLMLQEARAAAAIELPHRMDAPRARTVGQLAMPLLHHGGVLYHCPAPGTVNPGADQHQANVSVPGTSQHLCILLFSHA